MCLALPGEITELDGDHGTVDFGGVRRRINLKLVPQAKIGDFVIVHAGFAIQILQKEEAERTLDAWSDVLKTANVEDVV